GPLRLIAWPSLIIRKLSHVTSSHLTAFEIFVCKRERSFDPGCRGLSKEERMDKYKIDFENLSISELALYEKIEKDETEAFLKMKSSMKRGESSGRVLDAYHVIVD
ncbi:hypothetical protein MXB_5643, partial [Myxobolus squamalis]